jgi:hypothetical protein
MNANNIAPRVLSFVLSAIVTAATLAGIDTLAHTEHAANGLIAQGSAVAARPA